MCGIVGRIGRGHVDLGPALDRIAHRGPDDRGTYAGDGPDGAVDLGFVRLAIIDLSPAGHQPMCNEDGTVWLVFNGEIYNFRELRQELEALGHRFRSSTDSESIIHAYEQYDDGFVHRLRGMFGLAIWDARRGRLLLARDRLGIKPVYYATAGGGLRFCSEMKGILALGASREIDPVSLASYLHLLYVPPPRTIFGAIKSLAPGHLLVWEKGDVRVERYWDIARPPEHRDYPSMVEELRGLLDGIVKQHLTSDVPLGAFLSGGLDSSTLVGLMARHSSGPVRTYCMTFRQDEGLYDEREYAQVVARHFGTVHTEIPVQPDLANDLPAMVRHFDEPFGNPTALLVYLLSKETRKHVTVALSGDGGDEAFLGYPRYQGAALARGYGVLPRVLRQLIAHGIAPIIRESSRGAHGWRRLREFLGSGAKPLPAMYEDWIGYFAMEDLAALLGRDDLHETARVIPDLFARAPGGDFVDRADYVDLKSFLPNNLLRYTDRMSMAHALEVRVPYCDHRLVEFVAGVAAHQKMHWLECKRLFKDAVRPWLPPRILGRKKLGFNPPMGMWLNRELRSMVDEQLDPVRLRRQGYFDPAPIKRMIDAHRAGQRDYSLHIWSLLVFQTWVDLYQ
ncbi:MAG: asparagine synthase (glutamine-hydrolyzing) [Deltaproteobacteria bacterium]|nr:asparagine synthase (glutamine-hydrolyzing) [Deltaproteobacteria bacterium]